MASVTWACAKCRHQEEDPVDADGVPESSDGRMYFAGAWDAQRLAAAMSALQAEAERLSALAREAAAELTSVTRRVPFVDLEFPDLGAPERDSVCKQMQATRKSLVLQSDSLGARAALIGRISAQLHALGVARALGRSRGIEPLGRLLSEAHRAVSLPVPPLYQEVVARDNLVQGRIPGWYLAVAWPAQRDYGALLLRYFEDPEQFPVVLDAAVLGCTVTETVLPQAAGCVHTLTVWVERELPPNTLLLPDGTFSESAGLVVWWLTGAYNHRTPTGEVAVVAQMPYLRYAPLRVIARDNGADRDVTVQPLDLRCGPTGAVVVVEKRTVRHVAPDGHTIRHYIADSNLGGPGWWECWTTACAVTRDGDLVVLCARATLEGVDAASGMLDDLALVCFGADLQERHRVSLPLQWAHGSNWANFRAYSRARAVALPDGAVLVWICTAALPGTRPRQLLVYTVRWHNDACELAYGSSWSGTAPPGYATAVDTAFQCDHINIVPHATGRLLVSWQSPEVNGGVGRPVRPCIRALC
jgi:hypothetical protein